MFIRKKLDADLRPFIIQISHGRVCVFGDSLRYRKSGYYEV